MYCNTANILSCHSSFIILLHKMWHPISRFIPLWKQKKIVYWMQNRIPVLYVDYSNFPLSLILHSLASLAFLFQVIVLMNSWNLFEWSCLHNPAHRRLELVMQFRSFVLLGVILVQITSYSSSSWLMMSLWNTECEGYLKLPLFVSYGILKFKLEWFILQLTFAYSLSREQTLGKQ